MASNFLFVSAENDGIPHCKAGGMGDVVRDVPRIIASKGDKVHIVTPAYSRLHEGGWLVAHLSFPYRGQTYSAQLFEVKGKKPDEHIKHYVLHHPQITSGDIAHIYFNDSEQPFYRDSCTFSLFCAGVAEAILQGFFGELQIAHLHDWHSSLLLFLKEYHPRYQSALKKIRWVYSIHNLAIQGIRPFENNYASLQAFYPGVPYHESRLTDKRYPDCINLMAIGIRLSDAVHTVSPSYMEDVQHPSDPPHFIGGEGLEDDLTQAASEDRLFGILNGVNYSNIREAEKGKLWKNSLSAIFHWLQQPNKKYKSDFLAHTGEKMIPFLDTPPAFTVSSVARLTEQKFFFFREDPSLMENLLEQLKPYNGVYVVLGTGDPDYESQFREMSHLHKNFIFINGQSEDVIDSLYLESQLYLMPSLFEPCGISQMLAMRNGVPCLVHHTGGLIDTVQHGKTGFAFDGKRFPDKKKDLIRVFGETLDLYFNNPKAWEKISKSARSQRFSWTDSVDLYYEQLYKL